MSLSLSLSLTRSPFAMIITSRREAESSRAHRPPCSSLAVSAPTSSAPVSTSAHVTASSSVQAATEPMEIGRSLLTSLTISLLSVPKGSAHHPGRHPIPLSHPLPRHSPTVCEVRLIRSDSLICPRSADNLSLPVFQSSPLELPQCS